MRANPKNLIQVTDGEHASSFYTASRRGVGIYVSQPGDALNLKERICFCDVDETGKSSPRISPKFVERQEEMRAAAVRTMVAMGE